MTDRVHSLEAIRHIRGVLSASEKVTDFATHMAEERARADLRKKVHQVLIALLDKDEP